MSPTPNGELYVNKYETQDGSIQDKTDLARHQ